MTPGDVSGVQARHARSGRRSFAGTLLEEKGLPWAAALIEGEQDTADTAQEVSYAMSVDEERVDRVYAGHDDCAARKPGAVRGGGCGL
jgi:hypothetical protein